MPINLSTCTVIEICCDWMWDGQLNNIGVCIWGRVLFPPSHAIIWPPFLYWSPSKNEVPHVPIHPKKTPNTGFVLSTGLVKNPHISYRFWNSMLDRYAIRNFRVSVLITSMKWSPYFHNYSAEGTDAKYKSTQMILSVLSHGITSSFSTFVPWGRLSLSSFWSSSFFAYFKILSRIIIPDRP